jgi:two-component system OmpR family response regulator
MTVPELNPLPTPETGPVPSILIVDDEPEIGALVARCLKPGGFYVEAVTDGGDMRRAMSETRFDLIILDLNLHGEDGLMHLRAIRQDQQIPIIILTGRDEPIDRVVGLELGADDYVPKPFEPRELLARVRAVLRRTLAAPDPTGAADKDDTKLIKFDHWIINLNARTLTSDQGIDVPLTTAQFDILETLAEHPNQVLSRDRILDRARDRSGSPFDRSIDVHIGHLRKKLEANPKDPKIIKTVHGIGYVFVVPSPSEM